jgi:hypothetical protein
VYAFCEKVFTKYIYLLILLCALFENVTHSFQNYVMPKKILSHIFLKSKRRDGKRLGKWT